MAGIKSDSLAIDVVFEKERLEKEGLDKDEMYDAVSALAESKIAEDTEDDDMAETDDDSMDDDSDTDDDVEEDSDSQDDEFGEEEDSDESESDSDDADDTDPEEDDEEDASDEEKPAKESIKRSNAISLDAYHHHDLYLGRYRHTNLALEDGFNGIAAGWNTGSKWDTSEINWGEEISGFYDKIKGSAQSTKEFVQEYKPPHPKNTTQPYGKWLGYV
jgi:hypothetical protein